MPVNEDLCADIPQEECDRYGKSPEDCSGCPAYFEEPSDWHNGVEVHHAGWQALLGVVALCLAVAFAVFGPRVYDHFFPKEVEVHDFVERTGVIRVCLCKDTGHEDLLDRCRRECVKGLP